MLRFAMIGTGGFARSHGKRFAGLDSVQVVALCDVSTDITKAFAEVCFPDDYPEIEHYDSVEKLFERDDLDAVVIASPHTMHFTHAMQALAAGCHCYIEKPMVTSAPDAYTLRDEATKQGKIVVIGYNTPSTNTFDYLRETIRAKRLGELELVNGYISQSWYKGTKGKWRQQPELSGGGQAYDSGAHFLCSVIWTVESPVAAVCAFIDEKDTEVDINSVLNVRFKNGVMASLTIGGNSVHWGSFGAFVFEDGVIEIDAWNGRWIREYRELGKVEAEIELPPEPGHAMLNFIDAIEGRAEPRTTPTDGVLQTELMDAVYESARTGAIVRPKR